MTAPAPASSVYLTSILYQVPVDKAEEVDICAALSASATADNVPSELSSIEQPIPDALSR